MIAEIDDDTLEAAQRGKRPAAERVYAAVLPNVTRLATAICGSERSGRAAVGQVMKRSARVFPRWRDGDEADRWFVHQTIQFVRQVPKPKRVEDDLLYQLAPRPAGPSYRAFFTSLRRAPEQQQEALLLTHALRWNPRLVGIAMDCSMAAANVHLNEITGQMRQLSGDGFDAHLATLAAAYRRLPEDAGVSAAKCASLLVRARSAGRAWGIIKTLIMLVILAALAYAAWRFYPVYRPMIDSAVGRG